MSCIHNEIKGVLASIGIAASVAHSGAAIARDQIQIVGSSTVYPFATIVAERFGNKGAFKTPVIESTGTGGGMKLFCQGVGSNNPDITNASRAMKSSEWNNCQAAGVTDIIEVTIGNDGIAFANSIKGPKLNLTREQLWMALAEHGPKPAKWNEIDPALPDAPISVLVPRQHSGRWPDVDDQRSARDRLRVVVSLSGPSADRASR